MIFSSNLGYPRMGKNRELKFALEAYWNKESSLKDLLKVGEGIEGDNWRLQKSAGIDLIPSNDFSFYDHVLDTAVMLGAIPERFDSVDFNSDYDLYFAMARGFQTPEGENIPAMEMTKWFNTNYHYIVPEINFDTQFSLNPHKPLAAFTLAKLDDIITKPVILGPVSFLKLSKSTVDDFNPVERLKDLLPIYDQLFSDLKIAGVQWLQLDEPWIALKLDKELKNAYRTFFDYFEKNQKRPQTILTTYFADPSINLELLKTSPFEGLHIDLTCTDSPLDLLKELNLIKTFSLGLIDGRNIWRHDLQKFLELAEKISDSLDPDNLIISPSCSMLHVPQDVNLESGMDAEVKSWLSFACQKLDEICTLKNAFDKKNPDDELFEVNAKALASRQEKEKANQDSNKSYPDIKNIKINRDSDFKTRRKKQQAEFSLPLLPTTTIGSFPQTSEVRKTRAKFDRGEIKAADYQKFIEDQIRNAVKTQEKIGLDVLVHGEFERNDMVQYFGEKLDGFAFTENGWVQSYGSRYVRPPIIHSFVSRPAPITVEWSKFTQSLTKKPVKGMITGPVTILQWSFVRDDQPRSETCRQIAFSMRSEVEDLEAAGIRIIQIDEPALREGLPLHQKDWKKYLDWAVECFKITSGGVKDETQIHTHMCYSEFNDIIHAIAEMDADVISIEASRSNMELLKAFEDFDYPNDIGPGVYDIHSPIIPTEDRIEKLLNLALKVIPPEQLWVNPDCGLKTRSWEEVIPSLENMVKAAESIRKDLAK